ncbi:hypothetical protein [Paracoccus aminophilus]|uniref:hypothetical protein n=1 Tax=Paracoccus aminophilus TaxID=34003 RepID=UPI00059F9812|nr:hypothetical protein [Paracoccus aminophilus]
MASKTEITPLAERTSMLRFAGWILLGIPMIISSFAYAAETTRGLVIGLLFLVPLIVFVSLFLKLRDPAQYRPSLTAGLALASIVLSGLAFILLPMAFLAPSDPPFWRLFLLQTTLLGVGFLSGLIKHDAKALERNQRSRHKIEPGAVLIKKRPSEIYGFREGTGSFLFDWGARVVYGFYVTLIVIGAFFGGATPIILLRLIGPQPSLGLDAHASGITLMGMLILPFLGYILPALYRSWMGLRRIERAAGHPGTRVVYLWES